jgi:hypothetical protein
MKRSRGSSFEEVEELPDRVPPDLMRVHSVGPSGGLSRMSLPIAVVLIGAVVALAFTGRFLVEGAAPPPTPTPRPTPIAWIATTSAPTIPLAATASIRPGATDTPMPQFYVSLDLVVDSFSTGDTIRFTVNLDNLSSYPARLDTCPTYRMTLLGSLRDEPERLLNCPAGGLQIDPWGSVQFLMEFVVPDDAQLGQQHLVWAATSGMKASGHLTFLVGYRPSQTSTPND